LKSAAGAELVARRIQKKLESPVDLGGHEIVVRASIGIVVHSGENVQPEDLLSNADQAMYRAKTLGKSQQILFDDKLHHAVQSWCETPLDRTKWN
jgi:diguanylate cyclase (GGDEF)-like protein